jgi:hypothetical protein
MLPKSSYVGSNEQPGFTSFLCCDGPRASKSVRQTSGALHGAVPTTHRSHPLLKIVHYHIQERAHMGTENPLRDEGAAIDTKRSGTAHPGRIHNMPC